MRVLGPTLNYSRCNNLLHELLIILCVYLQERQQRLVEQQKKLKEEEEALRLREQALADKRKLEQEVSSIVSTGICLLHRRHTLYHCCVYFHCMKWPLCIEIQASTARGC